MTLIDLEDTIDLTGELAAQTVIQRAIEHINRINADTKTTPAEKLNQLTVLLEFSHRITEGFEHVRSIVLATVKRQWDDLPYEVRKPFDLRFDVFAMQIAPDLSWKTVENRIRMAETFFLDKTNLPEQVAVIKRLPDGKPVLNEKGKPVIEEVDFNPMLMDISKLTLARSVIESGKAEQNPRIYEMLADPHYRYEDLRSEMFSDNSKQAGIEPEIRFSFQGPVLVAEQNGHLYEMGEFDFEPYYDLTDPLHDLAQQSISKVLRCLNTALDEDITIYVEHKNTLITPTPKEDRRIR